MPISVFFLRYFLILLKNQKGNEIFNKARFFFWSKKENRLQILNRKMKKYVKILINLHGYDAFGRWLICKHSLQPEVTFTSKQDFFFIININISFTLRYRTFIYLRFCLLSKIFHIFCLLLLYLLFIRFCFLLFF